MVGTEPVPPRGGQEGSCAFVPGENATAQDGAAHLRKTAAELKRDLFGEEWFLYVPEGPNPNRQLRPLDLGEAGLGEVCRASKVCVHAVSSAVSPVKLTAIPEEQDGLVDAGAHAVRGRGG